MSDDVLIPAEIGRDPLTGTSQFLVTASEGDAVLAVYDWAAGQRRYVPVAFEAGRHDSLPTSSILVALKHAPAGQIMVRVGKPAEKLARVRFDGGFLSGARAQAAEPKPAFESSPPAAPFKNGFATLLTKIRPDRLCYEAPGPVVQVYDNGNAVQHFGQIGSRYFEIHHEPKGFITVDYKLPLTAPEGAPAEKLSGNDLASLTNEELAQLGAGIRIGIDRARGPDETVHFAYVGEMGSIDHGGDPCGTFEPKKPTVGPGGLGVVGEAGPMLEPMSPERQARIFSRDRSNDPKLPNLGDIVLVLLPYSEATWRPAIVTGIAGQDLETGCCSVDLWATPARGVPGEMVMGVEYQHPGSAPRSMTSARWCWPTDLVKPIAFGEVRNMPIQPPTYQKCPALNSLMSRRAMEPGNAALVKRVLQRDVVDCLDAIARRLDNLIRMQSRL